jgi:hypothetical protein
MEQDQDIAARLLMGEGTKKAWPLFTSQSPAEFYRALTQGLPEGTTLDVELALDGKLKSLIYDYRQGEDSFSFERDFRKNTVSHTGASVSASLQKQGIGRIVNGNLFRFYQKAGMNKITLSAGDVGAYAWARTGFAPSAASWKKLRESIGQRLDFIEGHPPPEGPLPHAYVSGLRKALSSDEPKSLWFLVDQEYPCYGTSMGKLLTLPFNRLPEEFPSAKAREENVDNCLNWGGALDMKDRDCVQRFEAYVQAAPSQKPSPRKPVLAGAAP